MLIAKQKRKENIAEYILYLWQLEDLLRALDFDAGKIYSQIVDPQSSLDDQQKQMLFFWYIDMVNLLKSEGKDKHGHLEHTIHLINDLYDLHLRLLKLPLGKKYAKCFEQLSPELPMLRSVLNNSDINDIELCFRALYSVMLLRLKNINSASSDSDIYINDVIELISPVIAMLAKMYKDVETGEVDLYKGLNNV